KDKASQRETDSNVWNSFKNSSSMDKDPNMQQMEDPEKRI
ncbi:MAG: hypothetical protein EZS28_050922, partial [Streblomastix strix]